MMKGVTCIYFNFLSFWCQAPNDTESEMGAANPTLPDTELCLLLAACWAYMVRGTDVFRTAVSFLYRSNRVRTLRVMFITKLECVFANATGAGLFIWPGCTNKN